MPSLGHRESPLADLGVSATETEPGAVMGDAELRVRATELVAGFARNEQDKFMLLDELGLLDAPRPETD